MTGGRQCCLCKASDLECLFRLDDLPISHNLRRRPEDPDPRFSLSFGLCRHCGLLQILDPIPPDLIYAQADTYTTGFQRPRHIEDLITTMLAHQDPRAAIDIGCNDGSLLQALAAAGYGRLVGVEPNAVAAEVARRKGHDVRAGYLTADLAGRLVDEAGPFDAVYLRHVVEHVGDLEGFFGAVRTLLRDEGLLAVELPDVEESLRLGSPSILWEEHVSYFTRPLAEHMLQRFGFAIVDRRTYAFGGGSQAFVARKQASLPGRGAVPAPAVEPSRRLLDDFQGRMTDLQLGLERLVREARAAGFQIVLYGAAPRSCLVVSVCRLGGLIDLVLDDRADIQDRLMPGTERRIEALTAATGQPVPRTLCLLGVGAENEFKVKRRVVAERGEGVVFVSLFPPRDTLDSVRAARSALGGRAGRRGVDVGN